MPKPDGTIDATCHCGAVTVTAPRTPEYVNECQCSICRRYAAAWAYYPISEVKLQLNKEGTATKQYIWGDRDIAFHFCESCGCVVCWWPADASHPEAKMVGINSRMMPPEDVARVERKISYDMAS